MNWRYYEQASPHSLRRYTDSPSAERFVPSLQKWVPDCAPESACLKTDDALISPAKAQHLISSVLLIRPA